MRAIHLDAIYHMPWLEYRHALPDGRVCLRLRTGRDDFTRVNVKVTSNYDAPDFFEAAHVYPMERAYRDEWHDYYEAVFEPHDRRLKYLFVLSCDDLVLKLDAFGLHAGADAPEDVGEAFAFAYAYPAQPMPEWARGCAGYQIFPDRFRREPSPDDENVEPWDSDRIQNEYRFGGNLRGILKAVPYLKDLGVTLIYTTPIFLSDSSHRYNTFDYYRVDPLLGTQDDLRALCEELHRNGMRIVLDGVFNHCGERFAPFVDAVQNGPSSPYYDWFCFDNHEACGYHTFGHWKYMPKLNLKNEACAQYFLEVGRYWLRQCGIDGWRLDVSPEVWPDFWRRFRRMMKEENPDSLMVAECWDDSREWLAQGDMFDSTMHYVLSRAIWNRFCYRKTSACQFDWAVNRAAALYAQRTQEVLWTFLGSHDTQRLRTRAGGDVRMLHAAAFFQFTYLGTPIIYYGDELGMEGGEDPYCRYPMRWDAVEGNPTHAHFRRLAHIRSATPALCQGDFRTLEARDDGLYAYLRRTPEQTVLCVLNTGLDAVNTRLILPPALSGRASLRDLYAGKRHAVSDGCVKIVLNAGEGLIFV
ncbi:MAG TPA: glycoside hydrolase family 13 protein [Candidatus Limiplasma stercoravium]|nr:glycoside hydrolase family 13 protein [Candidatus Limiplasma stercoravium]